MSQMFNGWAGAWGSPMSGNGYAFVDLIGFLVVALLGLGIITLVKYLPGKGSRY